MGARTEIQLIAMRLIDGMDKMYKEKLVQKELENIQLKNVNLRLKAQIANLEDALRQNSLGVRDADKD